MHSYVARFAVGKQRQAYASSIGQALVRVYDPNDKREMVSIEKCEEHYATETEPCPKCGARAYDPVLREAFLR